MLHMLCPFMSCHDLPYFIVHVRSQAVLEPSTGPPGRACGAVPSSPSSSSIISDFVIVIIVSVVSVVVIVIASIGPSTLHNSHTNLGITPGFCTFSEMPLKAVATLFVVFSWGICTASGIMTGVSPAGGENASRRHGTQVRACISPDHSLLAFVQHWHGMETAESAGSMTLQDDATLTQATTGPDFMLDDASVASLDSHCAAGMSTVLISECSSGTSYTRWAVFRFDVSSCSSYPAACGKPRHRASAASKCMQGGATEVSEQARQNLLGATAAWRGRTVAWPLALCL